MICAKCPSNEVVFEASQNMGRYCYNCGTALRERLPWVRLRWLPQAKQVFPAQVLPMVKQMTRLGR